MVNDGQVTNEGASRIHEIHEKHEKGTEGCGFAYESDESNESGGGFGTQIKCDPWFTRGQSHEPRIARMARMTETSCLKAVQEGGQPIARLTRILPPSANP
jgi:hypothetical protein